MTMIQRGLIHHGGLRATRRTLGWLAISLVSMAALQGAFWPTAAMAGERVLTDLSYRSTASGAVEIHMGLSGEGAQPRVFATDDPARIAVDLDGTTSKVPARRIVVGVHATGSIIAVEAGGRTRVVVDLMARAAHSMERTQDGYKLIVTPVRSVATGQEKAATTNPSGKSEVVGFDFRRGSDGEGRIMIALSSKDVGFDTSVIGHQVTLTLFDTQLPARFAKKFDVTDFATPAASAEIYQSGGNVIVDVRASADFEQLVYQSGEQLVMEISPPKVAPEETKKVVDISNRVYDGKRVSFNFQDIAVRAVLQLLADFAHLNIVVSDSVDGNITLRLVNVPWDQALDIVMDAKSLDKRRNGDVILVGPAAEIAERERVQLEAIQQKHDLAPLQTVYLQINYANAQDLSELLQDTGQTSGGGGGGGSNTRILSDRGSVTIDERTNTLLLTDTAAQIDRIRALIRRLDRPVRQVLIEARVVVANDDFSHELGARFGITATHLTDGGNLLTTSGSAVALDELNNASIIQRFAGNPTGLPNAVPGSAGAGIDTPSLTDRLNVNLPVANPAGQFGVSILAANYLLDLELSAMESENRGEVISNPRVITANQTEAFIRQGEQIPFQQSTSSGATSISFKDAVLELRVKPLVTPDNRIVLDLQVKQDSRGKEANVGTGATEPAIDTRAISTRVLVNNGETVVLGGIYEQTRSNNKSKVPLFGDIPIIGNFFKNTRRSNMKAELLIFVTPRILSESLGESYAE